MRFTAALYIGLVPVLGLSTLVPSWGSWMLDVELDLHFNFERRLRNVMSM